MTALFFKAAAASEAVGLYQVSLLQSQPPRSILTLTEEFAHTGAK